MSSYLRFPGWKRLIVLHNWERNLFVSVQLKPFFLSSFSPVIKSSELFSSLEKVEEKNPENEVIMKNIFLRPDGRRKKVSKILEAMRTTRRSDPKRNNIFSCRVVSYFSFHKMWFTASWGGRTLECLPCLSILFSVLGSLFFCFSEQ